MKLVRKLDYGLNLGKAKNLPRTASELISENEMPGVRKRNPEGRNV